MKFDFTPIYSITVNAYLYIYIYSGSIIVPCRSEQLFKNIENIYTEQFAHDFLL